MVTIKTKTIPNTKERCDRKKIDDDDSAKYIKKELKL